MKQSEKRLIRIIEWFVLLQPVLDFLTSLSIRFVDLPLTPGMVTRILFLALAGIWLFFFYDGPKKILLRGFFGATALYGVIGVALNALTYGFGTVMENGKMFFKMFYFVFVLIFFYALYKKYGFEVENKILTVVFLEYTASIFLSAVTGTGFVTYEYAKGYCGWFYAGNEVGAIVSALFVFALLYSIQKKNIFLKIAVGFLGAFSACYIGTKVPYLACLGAVVILFLFYGVKTLVRRNGESGKSLLQISAVLCAVLVLFQWNSPVKQNGSALAGYHYDLHVADRLENEEETETVETSEDEEEEEDKEDEEKEGSVGYKVFLVANWLLSNRLEMVMPAVDGYANAPFPQLLFGVGYEFRLPDGEIYNDLIEMDLVSLVINHGILGTFLYLAPILYFAFYCLKRFFRSIKQFFEMEEELAYLYSVIITFGCAFLAGHVLVAPAVSIYLAIGIIKLVATLEKREKKADS